MKTLMVFVWLGVGKVIRSWLKNVSELRRMGFRAYWRMRGQGKRQKPVDIHKMLAKRLFVANMLFGVTVLTVYITKPPHEVGLAISCTAALIAASAVIATRAALRKKKPKYRFQQKAEAASLSSSMLMEAITGAGARGARILAVRLYARIRTLLIQTLK